MENQIPVAPQYIKDFEQLGFGMFVHYGLYSQLNNAEWTYTLGKGKALGKEGYMKLAETFNCKSVTDIVNTAKLAGCKYITLTTRHHEGFSLYDTCGLNDFHAPATPTGRDVIREFVDECRKADIVPFFYHTTLDWYNDDFTNDFDKYLDYLYKSVEILCTNYGKIGGMWFDGNWSKPDADWQEDRLYSMIRRLQPEAMIINNTGLFQRGKLGNLHIDSVTYERGMAEPMDRRGHQKYVTGEMCETLCDHWGIADDINFKAPKNLIESLCNCRKVGANFLLNVGPAADGSIPTMQKGIMECMGRWMELFGKAVYNGRPYITYSDKRDFFLRDEHDEKTAYLFKFDLKRGGGDKNVSLELGNEGISGYENVGRKVLAIEWMDNGEKLDFAQNGDTLAVRATGYGYGNAYCVRVAKVIFE
jgi:alpha-L-fucosidase